MNVVWSCGRKGLSVTPPLVMMIDNVDNIAPLTCQGNLSPIIRIRGLQAKQNQSYSKWPYITIKRKLGLFIKNVRTKEKL